MDLANLSCPQYVAFNSESFQASLNNDVSSSDMMDNLNWDSLASEDDQMSASLYEGELSQESEAMLSTTSSEEKFVVHCNNPQSKATKLKKKRTIPVPFSFETDNRIKGKGTNVNVSREKDFSSQLRQHKIPPQTAASGITKVKPFNLTESKKRKRGAEYLPLAEQISALQRKTPERFHSTLKQEFQPQEHWSPPKLRPRTPNLQAVKRRRVVDALSREQQETKEFEEMKAYEFHARPVDPRIYQPTFVEKPIAKKTTKTRNIELKTAQRAKVGNTSIISEKAYTFRARPVPKNILAGPTGLGEKPEITITKPSMPKFTTEQRLQKRKIMEQMHESKESPIKKPKIVKSKPAPKVQPVKPKRTDVQPFSFDKVDQERYLLKQKKIIEEIEKENKPYIFKAQLMPSPLASTLPEVEKKPRTKPQPFNFCLDKRNLSKHNFTFEEENVSFKAQPATVLQKEPFVPEKLPKSFLEIQEFNLHTDRRASERLKLKEQKDVEELQKEQLLLAQKALEEEKERLEVLRLRQELVHKANPIRQYKPLEVKRSSKPLTAAVAPVFETDRRLRSRIEQ